MILFEFKPFQVTVTVMDRSPNERNIVKETCGSTQEWSNNLVLQKKKKKIWTLPKKHTTFCLREKFSIFLEISIDNLSL